MTVNRKQDSILSSIPNIRLHLLNPVTFVATLLFLTVLRNGFALYGTRYRNFENSVRPRDFDFSFGSPYVLSSLEWIGKTIGGVPFFIFYTVLVVIYLLLINFELRLFSLEFQRKAWIVISLTPAITIILGRFGTYDAIVLFSGILGGITNSRSRAIIYAIMFVGSHPEGAVVSAVCLIVYKFLCNRKSLRSCEKDAQIFFAGALLVGSLPYVFFSLLDKTRGSRIEGVLFVDSFNALAQDLAAGLLLPFSWFGSLLFIFLARVHFFSKHEKFAILFIVLFIGGTTLIASDGTRVGALAFTTVLIVLVVNRDDPDFLISIDYRWFFILYFIPPINVSNFNLFLPFHQILYFLNVAQSMLITLPS